MIVAIHQPEFLPWLGYFNKMARVDVYIVLDHVQFKRRYFENRNRIVGQNGNVEWVGVPVLNKGKYSQAINEVAIDNLQGWKRKLLNAIRFRYAKALGFARYFPEFEGLVSYFEGTVLIELNLMFIDFLRRHLCIDTPMLMSSKILESTEPRPSGSDLIRDLCLTQNATQYLCGPSGKDYLNLKDFMDHGIEVIWQDFIHPIYPQLCSAFKPCMSALDLLLCTAGEAPEYVLGQ